MTQAVKRIVIVGGGTAGWITAAMLSAQLPMATHDIVLVESTSQGTIGVGESTIPPILRLVSSLGIDEADFIAKTRACYKLGIRFVDWKAKGEHYFHPYGRVGNRIAQVDFYQCWLKTALHGEHYPLSAFSPCAVMAEQSRFIPPSMAQNTPVGGADYAVHLDARLVVDYLRDYGLARGVVHREGDVENVIQHDNGFIHGLRLHSGERIEGDLFIDCTGFSAALIGSALAVPFDDWSAYLPCDKAIVVKTAAAGERLPYTTAHARKAGWSWHIPLRDSTGHGYVYASQFTSDAEARALLMSHLDETPLAEPRVISFTSGRRAAFWQHNCVAVGLAAGFIEPLESTAIHFVTRAIDMLLRYFPDCACDPLLQREYNQRIGVDYDEVRDFIVLHYCTSQRRDSPFWRHCADMPLPESLQERIALFKEQGLVREHSESVFSPASWQSVFEGMGVRPRRYHPRVDSVDYNELKATLHTAQQAIAQMVARLPRHDTYLSRSIGNGK